MPIKDWSRYPKDWKEIRARILERAKHRCENCGVKNYAVGHRDGTGKFIPTGGNLHHDAAGNGELSYSEAQELVKHCNECCGGLGLDGERGIVIVLTIAHHPDPNPMNCDPENLHAWCQACHNRNDMKMRQTNAAQTRLKKKERDQMNLLEAAHV